MKNVFKPLVKSVLIPLGVTAAASATDAIIQKKIFGSGMTTLITSNEKMNEIIKITRSLEESRFKNEAKGQRGGFLGMVLVTLGASLLGNLLTGKK